MHWEAFGVIGLFVLFLGLVLYLPIRIWARYKLKAEPDKHPKLRLTRVGWVFVFITVLVLLGGFSMQYLAPASAIGQFVKTSAGRLGYTLIVVIVCWIVEAALKSQGIRLTKNKEQEGK